MSPGQGLFPGEVQGGAGDRGGHGGGDAPAAHGGELVGGQPEPVAHGVPAAVEVEVAVVGDVAVGGLVADGLVAEPQPPVRQGVGGGEGQGAGKAALAVGGGVGQAQGTVPGGLRPERPGS